MDPFPGSIVTTATTVHGNTVFVGVGSYEEGVAAFFPSYPCCQFRGSAVALDASTGEILWQTYVAPVPFSRNAIWGSAPAVDTKRNQVYMSTGNNYHAPQSYFDCVTAAAGDPAVVESCSPADNHFDSVIAFDMTSGAINWATRALPYDTWNVACAPSLIGLPPGTQLPNCAFDGGPD